MHCLTPTLILTIQCLSLLIINSPYDRLGGSHIAQLVQVVQLHIMSRGVHAGCVSTCLT